MYSKPLYRGLAALASLSSALAFDPCPLLGPNFPQPTGIATAAGMKNATAELKQMFDKAISTGNSSHGPIGQETTSFSVALFTLAGDGNQTEPYFWDYHYSAPSLANSSFGARSVDARSVYRMGSMTQVFNVWTLLVAAGEKHLDRPVTDFVPELLKAADSCASSGSPLTCVDWCEVTLRELASHMAGIGRDYGFEDLAAQPGTGQSFGLGGANSSSKQPCGNGSPCSRDAFFKGFLQQAPVYAPGTTPILSNAAFQILAYALESITGQKFDTLFQEKILAPLKLSGSSLSLQAPASSSNAVAPGNANRIGWDLDLGDAAPSLGLYSNIRDFAAAGQAMLSSTLLKPAQTRRWLKPVVLTSNPANSNGLPWEIYSQQLGANGPVLDIYTYIGSLKGYSSYLGLVPNYNVGFVVLAASSAGTPDLNAHADFVGDALVPALETLATKQALVNHAGNYVDNSTGARLIINSTPGGPGLEVLAFKGANGTDLKASLASLLGIEAGPGALSFRLYPTNLQDSSRRAFRAVLQDTSAFADAGTPTCISWMSVDALRYNGKALDSFVFTYKDGSAIAVEAPGFGLNLTRSKV